MKRFWLLLAALALLLAACGSQEPAESQEQALTQFLQYMKQGEYAKADAYVYTEKEDSLLSDDLENFDGGNRAFVDKLQAFTFEIKDTHTDGDKATITIQSQNTNMIPVFADVMSRLTETIMSDPRVQQFDDEQMLQFVNDMLAEKTASLEKDDGLETVDREFPVIMVKDKGKWKVDMNNEELVMMLTGNIFRSQSEDQPGETNE